VSKLVSVNLAKLGAKTPPPGPKAGESSVVAV
jgi:hypothetical protein